MKKRIHRLVSVLLACSVFLAYFPAFRVAHAADPLLTVSECNEYKKLISSSLDYTIAISSDKRVVYWGSPTSPVQNIPADLEHVGMVAAGYNFALALKDENGGTVVAWGDNTYNQCAGNGLTGVKYITAGNSFALALKNDGTVVAWGANESGQCDVPAGLSDVVAIEAGSNHALALKSDGTVLTWGSTYEGWELADFPTDQIDPANASLPKVVALDAPWGHNLAVREDGSVVAWGYNNRGQATIPAGFTSNNAVAVSGSVTLSMILMADGTVKEWGGNIPAISEPAGLSGVKAISSQQEMSFALVDNSSGYYKVIAWDAGGITKEINLSVGPKIVSCALPEGGEAEGDNSYIDVNFNTGIYGDAAGTSAVSSSAFVLEYRQNEGTANGVVIASATRTDGTGLVGGETTIRFHLTVDGTPSGQETIEIKPAYDSGSASVYDGSGTVIESLQTTGTIYLNTKALRFVSSTIDDANTYIDVVFNKGIYGDAQGSTGVSVSDFKFAFHRNDGSAFGATLVSLTDTDSVPITAGAKTVRFNFSLSGMANGKETIEIMPSDGNSVFSSSGDGMQSNRTTGRIPLSPPAPDIVGMVLAPDNSCLDITFNTGVYGDRDNVTKAGFDPVSYGDILCKLQSFGGGATNVSISSFTRIDGTRLNGGETVIRLNLSFTGKPTGVEYFGIWVERLYNSKGVFYGSENSTMIKLKAMSPSIGLCSAAPNNEYIDVNFNMGVYGGVEGRDENSQLTGVDKDDFSLDYIKGTGTTNNVTIRAVGANTGTDPAKPAALSGGEKTVRVFLSLTNPATGGAGAETVKISPKDNASIYSIDAQPVPSGSSTGNVNLHASFPVIQSYRLSKDNSYMDIDFNLGVYGNSGHTLPVSPSNFNVNFYTYSYNGGQATAATIGAITRQDGSPLAAGDRNLRLKLNITGKPSGAETIAIYPSTANPVYNSLGKSILLDPAQRVPDTFLNAVPAILTGTLAADLSYMDVAFSCGVYGDMDHTMAVAADDFKAVFNKNTGGSADGVSIVSVKKTDSEDKDDPASVPTGGETALRFFLSVAGTQNGLETIRIMPADGSSVYSAAGNPLTAEQSTPARNLTVGPPEIVSARLAPDNSYIDVNFSTGVYGDSIHSTGLNEEDFSLSVESNNGDVNHVQISSVRQMDGTSSPAGGEKALRLYLVTQKALTDEITNQPMLVSTSASGTETIEVKPAGGSSIYSFSGTAMDAAQTTGNINLAEIPRIVSAVMSPDYSFVDVTFSKGVYGAGNGRTPLLAGSFQLFFERNGGIAANASIKAVRKASGTSLSSAPALTGGESTVRIFLSVVGAADGKEWIKILPAGAQAIFDSSGRAMSADKSTGRLYLKGSALQIVSSILAEDNSYVDVNFNVGVYGSADGDSPVTLEHFRIAATDGRIASVTKTDGGALTGGETTLRFHLSFPYVQSPGAGFAIIPASLPSEPKVYNANGVAMPLNQQTGMIKLNDVKLDTGELSPDNAYVDLKFNMGVYGDPAEQTPIGPEDLVLEFSQNAGTATGAAIRSVRSADSGVEADAGLLRGGESTVRVFLNVSGNPDGKETVRLSTVPGNVIGSHILASALSTGAISMYSGTFKIVSTIMGDDNAYVDLTFSQGIYGDTAGRTPVDANDFTAGFSGGSGSLTGVGIGAVRKADGEKPETASMLTGGERTIRVFLSLSGTVSGSESLRIEPKTTSSIYPLRGPALSGENASATLQMISGYPEIISSVMAAGSKYVDVTFNIGVYGTASSGPVTKSRFNCSFNANAANGGNDKITVSVSSVRRPDSGSETFASALTGGEKTVRFFLTINKAPGSTETDSVIPTGLENIVITPAQSIYSSTGQPLSMAAGTGPISLIAPEPEFEGSSAAQKSSTDKKLQYIDVKFSTDVFGASDGLTPVDGSDFELLFARNSGNGERAEILSVRRPDPADPAKDLELTGGTSTVRFYIKAYFGTGANATASSTAGVETVVIKPKADSVFNRSGQAMAVAKTTGAMKLVNMFPRIVSTKMGPGNGYIDVTFSSGIFGNAGKAVYQSDFSVVFVRNGGTAANAYINWAAKPDNSDRLQASPLAGGEMTIRFFLTVNNIPSGVETIELIPDSDQLRDGDGLPLKREQTTGKLRLLTPYPPQWSLSGSSEEAPGWMSDYRISTGNDHTLIVNNDGTVAAFGDNSQGQANVPGALSGVDSVAAGDTFSAALKRDGTLVGWGAIKIPDGMTNVKMISAGGDTLFALRTDGSGEYISIIGDNYYRYDDDNDRNYYIEKLELMDRDASIKAISAGSDEHLLVLRSDGTVEAYDYSDRLTPNYYGQCSVPEGLKDVRAVSAGFGFSLALKKDGTVVGWGNVRLPSGGLANISSITSSGRGYCVLRTDGTAEVYDISGAKLTNEGTAVLNGIIGVSAGADTYLFVGRDGTVDGLRDTGVFGYMEDIDTPAGLNIYKHVLNGTLGNNSYVTLELRDSAATDAAKLGIYNASGLKGITAGDLRVEIVKGSQSLLGITITEVKSSANPAEDAAAGDTSVRVVLKIAGVPDGTERFVIRSATSFSVADASGNSIFASQLSNELTLARGSDYELYARRIDAGWSHTVAMKDTGYVFNWGDNTYGQAPPMLSRDNGAQVSAGYHHTAVLLHDGTVKVWGENYYGQLDMPGTIINIMQISAGGYHTLVLKSDGSVLAWGDDFYEQCTVPLGLFNVIAVSAGGHHSLALKSDGTVVAWGDDSFKQCSGMPAGLKDVVAVSAGDNFSLALKRDGTVVAWGNNSKGQISIPSGLTNVKAISAGYRHSLALKSDGTVVAWGDNSKGQCTVPSDLTGVCAVSAGTYHSVAIKSDSQITAWGDNSAGQTAVPESGLPLKVVSAVMVEDNSYVDIQFNAGIYGSPDGTSPVNAGNFNIAFDGKSAGGATGVSIRSVRKNDNSLESQASVLTGGENIVRVFLTVTGTVKGVETVQLLPVSGKPLFDRYKVPLQDAKLTPVFTLTLPKTAKDIAVDNTSSGRGTKYQVVAIDSIDGNPVPVYDYVPSNDCYSISWEHELKTAGATKNADGFYEENHSMLIAGFYSKEKNHASQEISQVEFAGKPMKFLKTAVNGDIKLDLYYILNKDLPAHPGKYKIISYYRGSNNVLYGKAVSLTNVAQMAPENVAFTLDDGSYWNLCTVLETKTDHAMQVDFTVTPNYNDEIALKTTIRDKADTYITNYDNSIYIKDWATISASVRNVEYPKENISYEPTPTYDTLPELAAGNKIAFAEDARRTEEATAGRRFSFQSGDNGATVTILNSTDGNHWTTSTCALPAVTYEGLPYTYFGKTEITDWTSYEDTASGTTRYVAIGNANVGRYKEDGSAEYETEEYTDEGGHPQTHRWTYETSIKIYLMSSDGVNWTSGYYPDFVFGTYENVKNGSLYTKFKEVVCNNNGLFVAYDNANVYYMIYSDTEWTLGKSFEKDSQGKIVNTKYNYLTGLFTKNNILVLTGKGLDNENLNIYWSTGGKDWTQAALTYKDPRFYEFDKTARKTIWTYSKSFTGMTYAHNTFAASNEYTIAASQDGKNWSVYKSDKPGSDLVAYRDTFFRTVYYHTASGNVSWLLSSDDLLDWQVEDKNFLMSEFTPDGTKNSITANAVRNGFEAMTLEYTAPGDGDVKVPVNSILTLNYTDELKQGADFKKITLKTAAGVNVPISILLDGENMTLSILPKAELSPITKYVLTIPEGALIDLSNVKANKLLSMTFTTGTSVLPKITGSNLGTAEDPSDIDSPLELCYSRDIAVNLQSLFEKISVAPKNNLSNKVQLDRKIEGAKLILTPVVPLQYNTEYVITIPDGAVKDLYGNEAGAESMEFTTGADNQLPKVERTDPVDLGERIATANPICVYFSEVVTKGAGFSGITLRDIRSDAAAEAEITLQDEIVDGIARTTLVIQPAAELALHHTYRVTIPADAVKDGSNNGLASEYSFEFTEEIKKSYPVLVGSSPSSNTAEVDFMGDIVLTYDRPIKLTDSFYLPGFVSIKSQDANHSGVVLFTARVDGSKLILTPNRTPQDTPYDALLYGWTYELRYAGECISDLYGNKDITDIHSIRFTMESQKIESRVPAAGGSDIPLDAGIRVVLGPGFDTAARGPNFAGITVSRMEISGGRTTYTEIASHAVLTGNVLYISPAEDLSPLKTYVVEIPRGAVKGAGTSVNNEDTFRFTTGTDSSNTGSIKGPDALRTGNGLMEGAAAEFQAVGYPEGTRFVWDFGDGATASGASVSHEFATRGEYNVMLISINSAGVPLIVRKVVGVLKRPDPSSIQLDATPSAPVAVPAGSSAEWVVSLKSGGQPLVKAPILVSRVYPVSENRPPETLATIVTDANGYASYTGTLPEGVPEYYVKFTYENSFNGVTVKKELRRILKSAVGKVEVSGYVNNDRNVIQSGASVRIGTASVRTDSTGYYRITGLDVGTYTMLVSADMHYDSVMEISLAQKSLVKNITLTKKSPTGNPSVNTIYINNTAPAYGQNFYFLQGIEAPIKTHALIDWNGHDPGYVEFNLNGTITKSTNFEFSMNAKELKQGDQLLVTCVTADGVRSPGSNARINIIDSLPKEFPVDLHPTFVGNKYVIDQYIPLTGISTPYIDNIPLLAGGPISFLSQPAHVTGFMGLDGTFTAVVGKGIDAKAISYAAQNNMLQKYLARQNASSQAEIDEINGRRSSSQFGSFEFSANLDANFNWNYIPYLGRWQYLTGDVSLNVDTEVYGKRSWGIKGIPVSAFLAGKFTLEMDASLKSTGSMGNYTSGYLDFSKIEIEISGGLDAFIASAGIYFAGGGKVRIDYTSPETKYYIYVKGYAKLKALLWSVNYPFLEYGWGDDYTTGNRVSALMADKAASLYEVKENELQEMSRDYLGGQSGWQPNGGTTMPRLMSAARGTASASNSTTKSTLRSNTYPYTDQKLVPYDNGAFMVLLEDDPARTSLNRTRVSYSIYNGSTWTAPLPIDPGDETADFKPVAAATGNGVLAAWENLKEVMPGDATLGDALRDEEIRVGFYDSATGKWNSPYDLTADGYLDHSPQIAAGGDSGILTWVKSKSDDYGSALSNAYSATDEILFSKWDGSSFSKPVVIALPGGIVVDSSVAYDGTNGAYACTLDRDNDLGTTDDREIYIMTYDGTKWNPLRRMTDNTVRDSSPQVCIDKNGNAFVTWSEDKKILYTTDAGSNQPQIKTALEDTIVTEPLTMTVNKDGSIALICPGKSSEGGQELYMMTYSPEYDAWSSEIELTSDQANNYSPSSVLIGDQLMTVYNRAQVIEETNPADGETYPVESDCADLVMASATLTHDLSVTPAAITMSDNNPYPGSVITVGATIENKGMFTEPGAEVAFYYGDPGKGGTLINTVTVSDAVIPGDSAYAETEWEVPSGATETELYVVANYRDKATADGNPTDNTAVRKIVSPDLEISALTYTPAGEGKYAISATVTNVGRSAVENATVSFHRGDAAGNLQAVGTADTGELGGGEAKDVLYLWSADPSVWITEESGANSGKVDIFASVDTPDGAAETTLANNLMSMAVLQQSLSILETNPSNYGKDVGISQAVTITFDSMISKGSAFEGITLEGPDQKPVAVTKTISDDRLTIQPNSPLRYGSTYTLHIPASAVTDAENGMPGPEQVLTFRTEADPGGANNPGNPGSGSPDANAGTVPGTGAAVVSGAYKGTVEVRTDAGKGQATAILEEAFLKQSAEPLSLRMPNLENTGSYGLQLPAAALSAEREDRTITMISENGTITLPSNMLTKDQIGNHQTVTVSMKSVNNGNLPAAVQKQVGNKPVIELTLMADEQVIEWINPDAPVTMSIPYKPTAAELADPDKIVVCYIDDAGSLHPVSTSLYNPQTGMVTFKTTRFSYYTVAYVQKSFTDLKKYSWAKAPIEALAARGIMDGMSKTEFYPGRNITRAEFLYMLVRTLGLSTGFNSNFSDVDKKAYYWNELGTAKALGISLGNGSNQFRPNDRISRQDMIVLTVRALERIGELKAQGASDTLARFSDKNLLSAYATDSVEYAVNADLIKGNKGLLNPLGSSTRAEAAVMLYRLLKSR